MTTDEPQKQKLEKLYKYISEKHYGGARDFYISDIATDLGITYAEANHLTYVLGYRRGRVKKLSDFSSFCKDAEVQRILNRIPDVKL